MAYGFGHTVTNTHIASHRIMEYTHTAHIRIPMFIIFYRHHHHIFAQANNANIWIRRVCVCERAQVNQRSKNKKQTVYHEFQPKKNPFTLLTNLNENELFSPLWLWNFGVRCLLLLFVCWFLLIANSNSKPFLFLSLAAAHSHLHFTTCIDFNFEVWVSKQANKQNKQIKRHRVSKKTRNERERELHNRSFDTIVKCNNSVSSQFVAYAIALRRHAHTKHFLFFSLCRYSDSRSRKCYFHSTSNRFLAHLLIQNHFTEAKNHFWCIRCSCCKISTTRMHRDSERYLCIHAGLCVLPFEIASSSVHKIKPQMTTKEKENKSNETN